MLVRVRPVLLMFLLLRVAVRVLRNRLEYHHPSEPVGAVLAARAEVERKAQGLRLLQILPFQLLSVGREVIQHLGL